MTNATLPKPNPLPAILVYGTPSGPALTQASWFRAEDKEAVKAGRFQSRESTIASHPHRARLAMATPSAAIGAGSVVQRTGQTQRRPHEEDDYRGAGAQAAGGAVEICHRWHRH